MTDHPAPASGRITVSRDGFETNLGNPRDGFTFWWRVWKFWIQSLDRLDLLDRQNGYEPPDKGGLDAFVKTIWLLLAFLIAVTVLPR